MGTDRKDQKHERLHWLYIKYLNGNTTFEEDKLLGQALRNDPSLGTQFQLWELEWEQSYAGNEATNKSWFKTRDKFGLIRCVFIVIAHGGLRLLLLRLCLLSALLSASAWLKYPSLNSLFTPFLTDIRRRLYSLTVPWYG